MEETVLVNVYKIGDIIYEVIEEVNYNNNHYVYLCNENDEKDIMIRKVLGDNLEPLETEEELKSVLEMLTK